MQKPRNRISPQSGASQTAVVSGSISFRIILLTPDCPKDVTANIPLGSLAVRQLFLRGVYTKNGWFIIYNKKFYSTF
jgi:hypothetical protein